jgi:replication factor A1
MSMQFQIKDLKEDSKKIDIVVKLVARSEPRYAKGYKIVTFSATDPTGTIQIPFWNNESDQVKVVDFIQIKNGYISTFRGQMQLNIGKYGSFQHVSPPADADDFEHSSPPVLNNNNFNNDILLLEALQWQSTKRAHAVRVYVKELVEHRTVRVKTDGKPHQVTTYLVGDQSGCIYLNLWDELGQLIEIGTTLLLQGAYIRMFRGQKFLNLTRSAQVTPLSDEIKYNPNNNLSQNIDL